MRLLFTALTIALLVQAPAHAAPPSLLPVKTILIETRSGLRSFKMEVAADNASRERGLMYRKHLARDRGMLFDFKTPVMTAFWMKDTPLALDILFVRADGTISTVAANAVPYSTAEIVSAEPIRAVIEVNGGLSRALGIAPGDRVRGGW